MADTTTPIHELLEGYSSSTVLDDDSTSLLADAHTVTINLIAGGEIRSISQLDLAHSEICAVVDLPRGSTWAEVVAQVLDYEQLVTSNLRELIRTADEAGIELASAEVYRTSDAEEEELHRRLAECLSAGEEEALILLGIKPNTTGQPESALMQRWLDTVNAADLHAVAGSGPDRKADVFNFAAGLLAQEEGYDPDDRGARIDVTMRRNREVTRFTEICLPLLEEIDQRDLDPAATERLALEAVATAWQKLQQEVR